MCQPYRDLVKQEFENKGIKLTDKMVGLIGITTWGHLPASVMELEKLAKPQPTAADTTKLVKSIVSSIQEKMPTIWYAKTSSIIVSNLLVALIDPISKVV